LETSDRLTFGLPGVQCGQAFMVYSGKFRPLLEDSKSLPLDDERTAIFVLNQYLAKNLWKTTVADSGNIIP